MKRIYLRKLSDNNLFLSYIRSAVSRLENSNHELSKSNQETADIPNEFFASVFEIESEEPLPDFRQCPYDNELSSMNISEDQIDKIINKLNAAKSQGPDNLHTKLRKETKSVIKQPLKMIFQKSIDEGKLPEVWKLANSTPIFKKRE